MIFEKLVTARKPHTCCQCLKLIQPGQRYVMVRITPNHDDYDNRHWLSYASHETRYCDLPVPS